MLNRTRNYAPSVDWSLYSSFSGAAAGDRGAGDWVATSSTVTLWDLLPAASQKWVFTASGNGYTVQNSATGKFLAISDGKLVEAASGTVFTARGENGKFYLYDAQSGLALTGKNSADGMKIDASPLKYAASQLWDLASAGDLAINIEAGNEWFTIGAEQTLSE